MEETAPKLFIWPIALSALVAALVFGGLGYTLGKQEIVSPPVNQAVTPTVTVTKTTSATPSASASVTSEASSAPTATITTTNKLISLSSPQSNAEYIQSNDVRITGQTQPGYLVYAYTNYSAGDLKCLTSNSFANGGAGMADSNGNFDFTINYLGYKRGQNTIVVAAINDAQKYQDTCFPSDNVTDTITYSYSSSVTNP